MSINQSKCDTFVSRSYHLNFGAYRHCEITHEAYLLQRKFALTVDSIDIQLFQLRLPRAKRKSRMRARKAAGNP
jgi:hypothetical protein